MATESRRGAAGEVFLAALSLGCRAFGGPVAHLGYFEREYVVRRAWIDAESYAGLVALCQALPGPSSSQVGFLIGWHRAGWRGALAAWIGFTLPAACLMYAFAMLALGTGSPLVDGLLHELKLLAVAVVALAVWSMARKLAPDLPRVVIALAAATALLSLHWPGTQLLVLAGAALAGTVVCRTVKLVPLRASADIGLKTAGAAAGLFLILLVALSIAAAAVPHSLLALAAALYHDGALVFGGGHVVLPLLRVSLVPEWLADGDFLTGYGAAQALPGPLFSIGAFVGAAAAHNGEGASAAIGALWAAVALVAIFLPGMLLAVAGVTVWRYISASPRAAAAIAAVNAAVVGLLAAALYDPLWTTSVHHWSDVVIAGFLAVIVHSLGRSKR